MSNTDTTADVKPILAVVEEATEASGLTWSPEHVRFFSDYVYGLRARVEDIAVRKAVRHGWCGEFGQALSDIFPDGPVDGTDSWRNSLGLDCNGLDREGYNERGYDRYGYNREGYDTRGYDRRGYNVHGFSSEGWDREGRNFWGWMASDYGQPNHYGSRTGFDPDGYNLSGYDSDGYDRLGYDSDGYDRAGMSYPGPFNRSGYDADGYTSTGTNRHGYTRLGDSRYGETSNVGKGHPATLERVKAELVAKRAAPVDPTGDDA